MRNSISDCAAVVTTGVDVILSQPSTVFRPVDHRGKSYCLLGCYRVSATLLSVVTGVRLNRTSLSRSLECRLGSTFSLGRKFRPKLASLPCQIGWRLSSRIISYCAVHKATKLGQVRSEECDCCSHNETYALLWWEFED